MLNDVSWNGDLNGFSGSPIIVGFKNEDEDWYLGARGIKFWRHPGAHLSKKPGRWLVAARPRGERGPTTDGPAPLASGADVPPPDLAGADPALAELQRTARDSVAIPASELAASGALPSARQYLEAYYGSAWPATQARIEAAGGKLDVPYTPHPWEEARERLGEHALLDEGTRASILEGYADWPATPTNEWLATQFGRDPGLEPAALEELAAVVAPDLLALEAAAQSYADLLDQELRTRWAQGRYLSAPYTTQGLSDVRGFYSKGFGGLGWSVVITLTYEECPGLESLKQELAALRMARDRRVLEFLRARMPR